MSGSNGALSGEGITKSALIYPEALITDVYRGTRGAVFHWKQYLPTLALRPQVEAIVGTGIERYRVICAPTGGLSRDNSEPTAKALIVQEVNSMAKGELKSTVISPDETERMLHIPSAIFGQPWELPGLESRGLVEDIEIPDYTGGTRSEAVPINAHNPFEQNLEELKQLGFISLQEEVFGSDT